MKSELERFETFAYDALQNDGWDDIEVDYYHSDIPPHDVYGVPIRLFKRDSDEESGAEAKYQLVMKCFCHRSGEDAYDIRLWVGADDPYGKKCNSFDEFKKCYEEALAIVKRDNIKESLDFVDAIDFANNLRPYDEGVADALKWVGRQAKNIFGTSAAAAQRNQAAAQQAQQTAQVNQQTQQIKNQTNALDDLTLAKNLNDIVAKALKLAGEGLTNAQNQQMQKNADKGEQEAIKKGATSAEAKPAEKGVPDTTAEAQTDVPENGGNK